MTVGQILVMVAAVGLTLAMLAAAWFATGRSLLRLPGRHRPGLGTWTPLPSARPAHDEVGRQP